MKDQKYQVAFDKLDENMQVIQALDDSLKWHDPKEKPFKINGFAWFEDGKNYRRLPTQPGFNIPEPVDMLANCTAGGQIRFTSNTKKLSIKVKLQGKANMFHMPATGQCGFDCYIGGPGNQTFCSVTKFDHTEDHYEVNFFERPENNFIDITLHFPLYECVKEVYIGVDQDAEVKSPPQYDNEKKLIFYGTSILQGGCASRPGMAYTNILSRRINLELINLGFSGNGKGEPNMAKLIREIENPACLVLDYEPNCVSTELYMETLPRFIQLYRERHQTVPVLVVSKYPYAQEIINPQLRNDRLIRLNFQKQLIEQLRDQGDENIYFFDGTDLLGDNWQDKTVDGTHATDLGFMSMADKLTPVIKKLIFS